MSSNLPSRLGVVVQARMGSRRLPGKVLMRVRGRTLLQYLVDGCRSAHGTQGLYVATSAEAADEAIARHCAEIAVPCYRGPLDDVAARFLGAAAAYGLDAFVRISADSPLVHPRLIEQVVRRYRQTAKCDLASNVLRRTHPSGMSVEVVRTQTLADAHPSMNAVEREHVTPYFYARPDDFRIASVERRRSLAQCKLAVDTPGDFARIKALIERLDKRHWTYSIEQLAQLSQCAATEAEP